MINTYYQLSSQELMLARNDQSQISQKGFELRLMEINKRFPSNNDISSINSFLRMFNNSEINFMPPISIMMKLSQVNFELTHKSRNTLLAKEIAELNKLCKGI